MKFNQRQKLIMSYLLDKEANINIEFLSYQFKVSTRSIYNDINKIRDYIGNYDMSLEIDQNRNYYLQGDVCNFNPSLFLGENKYSSEYRQVDMFKRIFLNGQIISYTELSDQWYISKTTIYSDINHFRDEIEHYDIFINNNNMGSYVSGEEENIQEYCIDKIIEFMESPTARVIDDIEEKLRVFFTDNHVTVVRKLLNRINEKLDKKLRETYFENLLVSLLVLINRSQNGFSLDKENQFITLKNDSMMLYGFTLDFVEKLTEKLKLSLNDPEIDRISSLFYAHGIEPILTEQSISPEVELIVDQSIEYMSEVMQVDYGSDALLRSSLLFHFEPMIHRLRMNIKINNPLLKELKKQYSIIFNATWYVYSTLMNKHYLSITEEEVSYLMVHFQASIERNLPSNRVLFVSPTGIGISELAINRLKNILPRYVSVEHTNDLSPRTEELDRFDLVIATIHVELAHKKVIQVSPLIDESDKNRILKYYAGLENKAVVYQNGYNFKHLQSLVDIETIYINHPISNKREAIEKVVNEFYENGYVTDGCLRSVLEREEMGDTALANGTAIPHSNMETVNQSKVAIVTFPKAINWGQSEVSIMFLICISPRDTHIVKNVLVDIQSIVDSKNIIENILSIDSRETMYEYLFEGIN